jgi:hypothetical protein
MHLNCSVLEFYPLISAVMVRPQVWAVIPRIPSTRAHLPLLVMGPIPLIHLHLH